MKKLWFGVMAVLMMTFLLVPQSNLLAGGTPAQGPASKVDFNAVLKEIMHAEIKDNQQTMAFWLPAEFFISMEEGQVGREIAEKNYGFLRKYLVFIVGQQLEEDDGTKIPAKKSDLLKRISLKMNNGEKFALVDNIPPKLSELLEQTRRNITANGGSMGKISSIFIFSSISDGWKTSFDIRNKNSLILSLKEGNGFKSNHFVWKTPLDSFQPAPPCKKCGEAVSAKWSFCPWCGTKIEESHR